MRDRIKVDLPVSEGWSPRDPASLAYISMGPGYARWRHEIVRLTVTRRRMWLRIVDEARKPKGD